MGYHPSLGRWLERDPGAQREQVGDMLGQYADGMSLYQYAVSNPVILVDPSGLQVPDRYTVGTSYPVIVDRLSPPTLPDWASSLLCTVYNVFINGAPEAISLAGHWASSDSATPIIEYGGGAWTDLLKGQTTVREGARELFREAAQEAWNGEPSTGYFGKETVLRLPKGLWTTGTINGFTYSVRGTYWVDVDSCSVTLEYPYHTISDKMDPHAEAIFPDIPMIALNYVSTYHFQWFSFQMEWSGDGVEFRMNDDGDIQSAKGGWPWGS